MDFICSLIPLALLFVLMLGFKLSGYTSALITLMVTIILALAITPLLDMTPERYSDDSIFEIVAWSGIEGVLKALFPIFLIILMAIFSYNIIVETGQIEIIKRQFIELTDDEGILVLLMVWGFGGLLEGMAGFGTAVAIPASILIGLGFKPFFSALVSLLGNTVATGFGALGVPVITLCNEGMPGGSAPASMISEVSAFTILQLSPLFLLLPFLILTLTDRKAWKKNILLTLWVGIISFGVQFFSALYIGAEAPAILGSIAAILALIAAARLKKRKTKKGGVKVTFSQAFKAWSVYIFILIFVFLSGPVCPPISNFLRNHLVSSIWIPVLDNTFRFGWISNAAFLILAGSFIGGMIQGLGPWKQLILLCKTFLNLRFTGVTILSLITLASIMNNSGMINSLSLGLVTATGSLYPLFAPLVGAVGTFVTGSDTSSNILFAKLQVSMSQNLGMTGQMDFLGMHGSESDWLLAANTTGATGGKMISPQNIAIAAAACGLKGDDDKILRAALPYAAIYVAIGGLMVIWGCLC